MGSMAVLSDLSNAPPRQPWCASAVTVAKLSWEIRRAGRVAARLSLFAASEPPLPGDPRTRRIGRVGVGERALWVVADLLEDDDETHDALVEALQQLTLTARRSHAS